MTISAQNISSYNQHKSDGLRSKISSAIEKNQVHLINLQIKKKKQ